MEIVSKEYFACKCLEQVNNCSYLYRKQIKGIISAVQHKFQIKVDSLSDIELENYVAEEIKHVWDVS